MHWDALGMNDPEERRIVEFAISSNIERFRRLLREATDERLREVLSELLAAEEARLLEMRRDWREDAKFVDRVEHS
jgi:hypothetical protein